MKRNSVAEKITLIIVVWCLMRLAYHVFVTRNLGWEIAWLVLAILNGINWGYWSEDAS